MNDKPDKPVKSATASADTLKFFREHGMAASPGSVAAALGISTSAAAQRLVRLVELNQLERVSPGVFDLPGRTVIVGPSPSVPRSPKPPGGNLNAIKSLLAQKQLAREALDRDINALTVTIELLNVTKDS